MISSSFGAFGQKGAQRGWFLLANAVHEACGSFAGEWPLIGEQFIQQNSEGPDVGSFVGMFAVILLGRHVGEGADEHAGLGSGGFEDASDAEIDYFYDAFLTDHDVAGLDVAMNDAAFVGVIEGAAGLNGVDELQGNWQRGAAGNNLLDVFAFDEFHGDIGKVAGVAHVVDGDDVGMLKAAGGLRFPIEALKQGRVIGHAGGDGFQGDEAVNYGVAGAINHTHGAVA